MIERDDVTKHLVPSALEIYSVPLIQEYKEVLIFQILILFKYLNYTFIV